MYKLCLLLVMVISGCATYPPPHISLDRRGQLAVFELRQWYESTVQDCGGADSPSYRCSGVALRTTASNPGIQPWEPSAGQLEKGSVAFSWLRHDSTFGKPFGNLNGLILYPPLKAPEGKLDDLDVLCTFPINANTNQRPTLQGCGPITGYETTTDTCQALGVDSARHWLDKYPEAGNYRVCGWDLRAEPVISASAFHSAVEARGGLSDALWPINNEVLLRVWEPGQGGRLPLHSFFYVEGERDALAKAQFDQIRYAYQYGPPIPVMRVKFPSDRTERVAFSYEPGDQALGQPTPTPTVDFEEQDVGAYARVESKGVEFILNRENRGVSDKPHGGINCKIEGKHIEANSTVRFVLTGAGPRVVSFSWGCSSYCGVQTVIAGKYYDLREDEEPAGMQYGTHTFTIDGPEVVIVTVDTEEDDSQLVLDNLVVRALP
ncbi:hypothetical protein [Pseudomonas sp. MWU13-3659]|uniref:hypothetical protein n=1 Tax=Pseudomonas sp. MWU13-3659 TaxID=2986964 RepID=UPI002074EA7E|nr:hypothetical protein [Pseudomonas sp. MWU13-3659]